MVNMDIKRNKVGSQESLQRERLEMYTFECLKRFVQHRNQA